ncbi:phosphotransferase family protein [Cytobacillus luteolus]|nr:phosphotransferase [Cytobacillus luteolus]MBP1941027.1 aminoglycoside phosphotransferase (APT) family kinase protein [Cytobacillus luteolus]
MLEDSGGGEEGMESIKINELPIEITEMVGALSEIAFPKQGYTSDVGIVKALNSEKFVIKRSKGEQFCNWLKREAFVLKCLKDANLPVPRLLKFVEGNGESWMLTQFMEGQTLRSYLLNEQNEIKRHEVIYQFGKVLKEIHSTPCPSELKGEGLWLDQMLETAEYNLLHYETDGNAKLLQRLKEKKPVSVKQALIHGDFTIDNVLVKEGLISAVIDWNGGAFGDPRYDAALAIRPKQNAFENESDRVVFFEGYGGKRITESEFTYFEDGLYNFF